MSLYSITGTWRGRPATRWVHASDRVEAIHTAARDYGMSASEADVLLPTARLSDVQADYDTEKREGWVYG